MHWNVVGHESQKEYFQRAYESGTLSHAYFFHGPQGIGKRMFADALATLLSAAPDQLVLGSDVESARAMKQWAYARPLFGERKTVRIDDADCMSAEAANTLLKILEEPPQYLHFFLVSSRPGRVLPTILSRCHSVAFHPLDVNAMETALRGIHMSAEDQKFLKEISAGRPGIALQLIREEKLSQTKDLLGEFRKTLSSGVTERLLFAKRIADDDDAPRIVSWWLAWTHANLSAQPSLAPVAAGLLDLSDALADTKFNRRLALEQFFLGLPFTK